MDGGNVVELIEKLGKTFEDFKQAHDAEIKEIKAKGAVDATTRDKIEKINAALDDLQAKKDAAETAAKAAAKATQDRVDALEKKLNRPGLSTEAAARIEAEIKGFNATLRGHAAALSRPTPPELGEAEVQAYKAAFSKFLRKGRDELDGDERKALAVGSDPDGGFLVRPDISGRIVTRVFDTSPIRQIASVQTISTDALEGIRDTDEAGSGGWVSETGARSESTTPQLGAWRIPVHEIYAEPRATQKLLDDASVDVEAWLATKVADKITRVENAAFVTGNGVGKPRGFTTYPTAATADGSRAWGTFEHVATAANGDFNGTNPADVLFTLIAAFKQPYLNNANWVTRRSVIAKIRKFKESTTNAYMWQPGLQQGQPAQLLGYPIVMAEDMPALATDSLSLALGDFREAYQIVDRQGFIVLRDPYTAKPYVKFYTRRRVGGDAVQFEALKFIKFGS